MKKNAILIILDGWGVGSHKKEDAIFNAKTPFIDMLQAKYPCSTLKTSGEDVGLPDGQMGNSEVGHLNIGAGRIVYQDLVKINKACNDGSIAENSALQKAIQHVKTNKSKLHFMGLLSDGGVHSSMEHLYKMIEVAEQEKIEQVMVHCFMDGRDTDPKSGKTFLNNTINFCKQHNAHVASVVGRFYAMDRDKRWERVKEAHNLLTLGEGTKTNDVLKALEDSYNNNVTDEFIKPISNSLINGRIEDNDAVVFYNFRNDRAKEITQVLTQQDMPEFGMKTVKNLLFCCMTPYDDKFNNVEILFPKENVNNTLGEYLSTLNLKQMHTAETEKYAHVTFFLNGGRETPFNGEDRVLIPSPKVATYDLKPEMSAYEVAEKLAENINKNEYNFIVVNFANGDMVGHTGVYSAITKAVEAVDSCVEKVINAAIANNYEAIIIADHGNADNAMNEDGSPNTAHSLNPVPFIYVSENVNAIVKDGRLADVAPSILHIMGLEQPKEMTGENLICN